MFYSLKSRIIAIFTVLLVLSFGTMSLLFFNESRAIIRNYIESSALEKMEQYASFANMALSQMYDLSSIVFNSDETREWDNAMSDALLTDGEKMLANLKLSLFLTRTTNSYSIASSVNIYRFNHLRVGADNDVSTDPGFLAEDWYYEFKNKGNRWVPAHVDPIEAKRSRTYSVISLLLPIGTFEPTMSRSLMKVNVNSDFFREPLNRIHLGESGTIFLLDQDGRPILGQDDYYDNLDVVRMVDEIREDFRQQGVIHMETGSGGNDIFVYNKIKPNGWILVGSVSEKDLYANLFKLRTTLLIVSSLLLMAAILVASWLSFGISRPLSRLASAMRYVQKGDFVLAEHRIPPEGTVRNEVGYVTSTFRNMLIQLRLMIKTEFELKLLRQQAEYKALLMQINPHFLFNTLELLSSLTMQKRNEDAAEVIDALGKMMRYSLKIQNDLVPLAEELKYTRFFLAILKTRFGDRLDISLTEHGKLEQLQIVKFLLQPLIENAVKFGFQRQMDAKVAIEVRTAEGRLYLAVSDNGPGMEAELVEKLQSESKPMQFDEVLIRGDGGIGLRNVIARCRLYYGPLFELSIHSRIDEGTRIELVLPKQGGTPLDI